MAMPLYEDELGDPRNAHYLAVASELAYLPEAAGAAAFKEQLGLDARLISRDHTQVYVGHNDGHIVAAFRGTESPTSLDGLKDWLLADAVNLLIIPSGEMGIDFMSAGVAARFHKGFMTALAQVWSPFLEAVKAERARKDRPIWLTGHSLGGALALLAGYRLYRQFIAVHQIYTFGAPMVGNAVAMASFAEAMPNKIYRYVNGTDPVPMLPTVSLVANDYGHCDKEMALGLADEAGSAAALLRGYASKAVDGVLNLTLVDDVWQGVLARVAAHGLDHYRKLMNEHLGGK